MSSTPASKPPNAAERALKKMSPELRAGCEKIRKLLAKSGPNDTRARYQLGELVKAAQDDPEKYGKGAVRLLAAALGQDKSTLYRCAQVVKCWSEEELNNLLEQTGVTGIPIAFTHLVEIATVSGKRRRQSLVTAVLDEGLSLRSLQRRIKGEPGPKSAGGPAPVTNSAGALRSLRAASQTWMERIDRLEADVRPLLTERPPTELIPDLRDVVEAHRTVGDRLARLMSELTSMLDAVEHEAAGRIDTGAENAGGAGDSTRDTARAAA